MLASLEEKCSALKVLALPLAVRLRRPLRRFWRAVFKPPTPTPTHPFAVYLRRKYGTSNDMPPLLTWLITRSISVSSRLENRGLAIRVSEVIIKL